MGNKIIINVDDIEEFDDRHNQYRQISAPLLIGIILLPIIFSWFTLQDGYSTAARTISLIWMILSLGIFIPLIITLGALGALVFFSSL